MASGIFGQLTGQILSESIGYGVGGAISPALAPVSQELANQEWQNLPVMPNSPEAVATMAVQGVMSEEDAAQEARLSGINGDRFHKLFLVNGDPIAPEQALDLWNRGEISEGEVNTALLQSRLKPEWVDRFKLLRRAIIQAADLAEMVVQSVLPQDDARKGAAKLGLSGDDFDRLVRLAGNPFGPETTLSLWNRGILNEQEATLALRQSRLKPEWIEQFKQSRFHPASVSEAVEAVVKERLSPDAGRKIASENGIDSGTFDLLVEAAGRPIGTVQALTLYNRNIYKKSDVREVVARSNIRTEYTDAILHLAVRYPSMFQVRQLVQHGAIDDEYATRLLTEQGYPEKLAAGVVSAGHNQKNKTDRDLTKSEIVTLYTDGAIARTDGAQMLSLLGYDETESNFLLEIADFRRVAKYLEAVISRVHSQYVAHRINEDTVTTTLDRIGVPTTQREDLLSLWVEERAANVRTLTPAQIVRAAHQTVITTEVALEKLQQLGYSYDDSVILLSI